MDGACFPSPDEAHDSRQPRTDNRHASPPPHHCADLTRSSDRGVHREARKDVAVRPERMSRCQPHDLEGDVANLFRGRLVAVDRPRVDQRRRAPGDHHYPYLGPVEPLEHHPARLLDASPLVRKGASSRAARLYRSSTKRDATSRLASFSLSNASRKIVSALSQRISLASSATDISAGVIRTKNRKLRLGTPGALAVFETLPDDSANARVASSMEIFSQLGGTLTEDANWRGHHWRTTV